MKNSVRLLVPVLLTGLLLAGCGKTSNNNSAKGDSTATASSKRERKVLYWYDPMSPTIHFDHPGKSPTMDMDLVPMYADEGDNNPNVIRIDPAMVQNIGVVTAPVERRSLTRTINTYGVVVPDEKTISDINARVSGWVEKLYFDYTGKAVRKGEPMAVIYSPELIAAEQEFLQYVSFAAVSGRSVTQPGNLIKSARERLTFFGMNDRQIDGLQSTGKVLDRVTIHSPSDGVILEKNVFNGQKISAGQTLFTVADLQHVWILADVFRIDMPFLKLGSPATVAYSSAESYDGSVDFIYPEVDATARSVKVRIPLYNPDVAMKVGQYVNVAIHSPISYDAIAVPSQAVINTGLRQVVAVALGGGRFEIREVKLGAYADGYYEVLNGLSEGDTIVTSGQFLIDSDANLKFAGTAMEGTSETGKGSPGAGGGTPEKQTESGDMDNMPGMDMNDQKTVNHSPDSGLRSSAKDSTRQES
ncbi:MAG TPA: efflux RND transporter periplasmic adaptor subunit [Candidatus Kryptobacter bacterium]|nr:efflux RND transporter periplasmic adaptor subunit [Candidatus Kryptobacter bacterium]